MSNQMGVYTEVSKLVGTGAVGKAYQGVSVKLSEDGNFLFVGGQGDKSNIGAVWFYEKINSVWSQMQKIVPTGNSGTSYFGNSIAVNPSMNTLIVGAYYDNNVVGASFVFTFNGTAWNQQGNKLVGNGRSGTGGSYQGMAVALSADGNTAIAGGPYDGNFIGAAWIFVRTGITWSQQGSKLVGTGYSGSAVYQGNGVALTSDGNLAVVGGYNDNDGIGAIWVYLRSADTSWNQVGTKITATDEIGDGFFGSTLTLSGDDQTLVVGGNGDNTRAGAVWIFKRNESTFTQFGNKLVGTGASSFAFQGFSVAVNKLGTLVASGARADSSYIGAVWMFYFDGTKYNQLGNKISATDAVGAAYQGHSVSLDGSGSQLLFGGWNDNGGVGAAWIYENTAITNSPTAAPTAPTIQPSLRPTTPTTQPSLAPTTPTISPSDSPTVVPTIEPSIVPTIQPSAVPTTQPSLEPSTQPSVEPTLEPSAVPSWTPTLEPTVMPSVEPTFSPSVLPTVAPSAVPVQTSNSSNDKLSSGGIAGIVIGVLVAVVVLAGVAWSFLKPANKSRKEDAPFVPDKLESGSGAF